MLQKLSINNYAIIDKLEVIPAEGLNIVTGETGAGKSIILGALSLILGDRADTSVLINKDEKCIVEAVFDVTDYAAFRQALKNADLDDDKLCIIRREINTSGKSRAFVNDTPVRLNELNELTSYLVDLHQQFDHLALDSSHFQMDVLDAVAGNAELRKEYGTEYNKYSKLTKELNELKSKKADWQKEADYKQFLLDELQEVALKNDELEESDKQLKKLSNAEHIIQVLQDAIHNLDQGEQPLVGSIKRIAQQLDEVGTMMDGVGPLASRVNSVYIELKDIVAELEGASGGVSVDEEQLQLMQERLDAGYKLLKKHGVQTTAELLAIQEQLEEELKDSLDLDDTINKKEKEQADIYKKLNEVAATLSQKRQKQALVFAKEVNKLLALVGMPNALFTVEFEKQETPNVMGMDEIQFYFDANNSGRPLPIHKVASGGEMSRIMLCIKSLTAKAMHLPTLIFDEVDTGISGEAAKQVGILLKGLAGYHQVICITHQPQVAAKADTHMFVYKEADTSGSIKTRLRILSDEERVTAIAKMIGGEQPGDAAMQNAKELVTS
ncbi:MAG: DNA repair protein RecN [Chitinophagaceae bacterium]|nr:DNA repair protein RecN [Chitinophagaceae bacterium]